MKKLSIGPLLGLESDSLYSVCFATARDVAKAEVSFNGIKKESVKVGETPACIVWRTELQVTPGNSAQQIEYQVLLDNQVAQCQNSRTGWLFIVPDVTSAPRFAYTSCNGFSSADLQHKTTEPYHLWERMVKQHQEEPFAMLLMGGDQLYADSIWHDVAELKKWSALSQKEKLRRSASKQLCVQLERFYEKIYQNCWSDKSMSLMLATVPSVMMWDDHDIFDGWGSYPEELQNCDIFQAIYRTARRYFELFQIRSKQNTALLDSTADHYAFAVSFRNYHILALDNRAERTLSRVMSDDRQWPAINNYLTTVADDGHLLVLSAVPVVYRDFSFSEDVVDSTPWEEELTDDLKDHWRAKEHQGERARLIHRLLDNAVRRKEKSADNKTIIFSGDVHIGSVGVINDRARNCKIHQVVSSGIVHPAPSRLQWLGIMAVTNDRDEYLDDIQISMLSPYASDKYIRHRNFVSLFMGSDKKLWVNWETEGRDNPYYPVQ